MGNQFYVYELIDPRDGAVFYVGKGCGKRIEQHAKEAARGRVSNPAKFRRITSIHADGMKVVERIVQGDLSERQALSLERRLIAERRKTLTNVSYGELSVEDILVGHAEIGIQRCEHVLSLHEDGFIFPDGWVSATEQWLASLRLTVSLYGA